MKRSRLLLAACLVAALPLGCAKSVEQVGGVAGDANASGKPLPEKTTVVFSNPSGESGFTASIDGNGHYSYTPAQGVALVHGKYKVYLTPPPVKTIDHNGLTIVDPHAKPVKLDVDKKYLDSKTTPLEIELSNQAVVFDIKI